MSLFEYKVVPAPRHGKRAKGAKGASGRFASALAETINEMSADGWEYLRAESLPADERSGFMRKRTELYHNVLVFRREAIGAATAANDVEPEIVSDKSDGFNPFKRLKAEPKVQSKSDTLKLEDPIVETAKADMDVRISTPPKPLD